MEASRRGKDGHRCTQVNTDKERHEQRHLYGCVTSLRRGVSFLVRLTTRSRLQRAVRGGQLGIVVCDGHAARESSGIYMTSRRAVSLMLMPARHGTNFDYSRSLVSSSTSFAWVDCLQTRS